MEAIISSTSSGSSTSTSSGSSTSSGGGSLSVDSLSGSKNDVIDSNEKTAECKERAKVIMKNEDEYYYEVKSRYLKNVSEMLEFCSDLHNFVTAARDSLSCIEDLIEQIEMEDDHSEREVEELIRANVRMAQLIKISKIMEDLKASDGGISTHLLKKTMKALFKKHEKMMESLQKQKLDQKYSCSRIWRKAAKAILMVIQAALSFIIEVANWKQQSASTPSVSSTAAILLARAMQPVLGGIYDMIIPWITEYENSIEAKNDLMKAMRKGTEFASADLDNLKRRIGLVVNEIDSVLRTVKFQTEGQPESTTMKGIKEKLVNFEKKIDDLEAQTKICEAKMEKAKEKALENFESEAPKKNQSD